MKKENNDRLKSLFEEINLEKPSTDFESKLMQRIEFVAVKTKRQRRLKKNLQNTFAIFAGIGSLICLPIVIFRISGWSLGSLFSGAEVSSTLQAVKCDPLLISIPLVVLLLLMSDTIIRKYIWNKHHKD